MAAVGLFSPPDLVIRSNSIDQVKELRRNRHKQTRTRVLDVNLKKKEAKAEQLQAATIRRSEVGRRRRETGRATMTVVRKPLHNPTGQGSQVPNRGVFRGSESSVDLTE